VDPNEINRDNLNNVKHEAGRYFRNKKRKYPKDKINVIAMNNKNKNIRDLCRGINELKKGYIPRNNLVKDENGDILLNRWKNYFSQFSKRNVSYVRQIEVHMAELLVPAPSRLEVEIAIAKLKNYK
jgi:hypothetical protein